jgi:hypothetical protein
MSEHEIKQQLEAIFGVYRGTEYEDGVLVSRILQVRQT